MCMEIKAGFSAKHFPKRGFEILNWRPARNHANPQESMAGFEATDSNI